MLRFITRPSLLRHLLFVQAVLFALLVGVTSTLAILAFYQPQEGELHQQLQVVASGIAGGAAMAGSSPEAARDAGRLVVRLFQQGAQPPMEETAVAWLAFTRDGRLLARSDVGPATPALAPTHLAEGGNIALGDWPLVGAWSRDGSVLALAGLSPPYRESVRWAIAKGVLTNLALLLGTVLLGAGLAIRIGLAPLRRFAAALQGRDAQDLRPLDTQRLPHEIQPIATAVNSLLARLAQHREADQVFFASAAHELKTPLAAINAQAHRLATAPDAGQRSTALHALEGGVQRAVHALDKVLALARAAAGQRGTLRHVAVDMAQLVRAAVQQQAERALASGHDLGLTRADACPLQAEPELLQAAINNLLDNALRHTPPGTHIDVSLACDGHWAQLCLDDSGPGIPPELRTRVFERFERGPGPAQGSGLGLAVVADAAKAHGGQAWVEASSLGGARFVLRIPVQQP